MVTPRERLPFCNRLAQTGFVCVSLLASSAGLAAPTPDRPAPSGAAKLDAERCTDALRRAATARDRAVQKALQALAMLADSKLRSKSALSHQKALEQRAAAAERARKSAVAAEAKPAAQPNATEHARAALREYDAVLSEAESWERTTKELRQAEAQMSTLTLDAAQAARDAESALDDAQASFKRLLEVVNANSTRATVTAQKVSGYAKRSQALWGSATQPAHDAALQTLQKAEEKVKRNTELLRLELAGLEAPLKQRGAPARPRPPSGSAGVRK